MQIRNIQLIQKIIKLVELRELEQFKENDFLEGTAIEQLQAPFHHHLTKKTNFNFINLIINGFLIKNKMPCVRTFCEALSLCLFVLKKRAAYFQHKVHKKSKFHKELNLVYQFYKKNLSNHF